MRTARIIDPRILLGLLALLAAVAALPAVPALAADDEAVVTARSLNIRGGPDTKFAVIRSVKRGTRLAVEKVVGQWVKLKGEGEAWAARRYLKLPRKFRPDKQLIRQDAFLDWAGANEDVDELWLESPGRISVVLAPGRYDNKARVGRIARAIACAYRDRTRFKDVAVVTVWTAPGPGRREVLTESCE